MKCDQMRNDQAQQDQRHCDHVECKEAVQRGVTHHVVTSNQQRQVRADEGDGSKQVHDDLSTPVAHLTPWQKIAHEGFSHERQENGAAEKPNQLAWLAVAAVHQAAEHVQVNHDEEGTGTGGVHVTYQPTPRHVTHDVLN